MVLLCIISALMSPKNLRVLRFAECRISESSPRYCDLQKSVFPFPCVTRFQLPEVVRVCAPRNGGRKERMEGKRAGRSSRAPSCSFRPFHSMACFDVAQSLGGWTTDFAVRLARKLSLSPKYYLWQTDDALSSSGLSFALRDTREHERQIWELSRLLRLQAYFFAESSFVERCICMIRDLHLGTSASH